MKRIILLVLLAVLWALPAFGAGTEYFPNVLISQACTDDNATPAGATAGASGGTRPAIQTGGATDGRCDHDSRIITGAITGDTTFGPFSGRKYSGCVYIFADGNTVTGGDTKWRIQYKVAQPHDAVAQAIDNSADGTGVEDVVFILGVTTTVSGSEVDDTMAVPIADRFYLLLDLNTATSWTGEMSLVACN